MKFEDKQEFLDKYFMLCEEYKVYVGTARPGPVRLYEMWGENDGMWERTRLDLEEDIGV